MADPYYGLYCPQCGVWGKENLRLIYYPAIEIANAYLTDSDYQSPAPRHLWEVTAFGEQVRRPPTESETVCPHYYFYPPIETGDTRS